MVNVFLTIDNQHDIDFLEMLALNLILFASCRGSVTCHALSVYP